MSSRKEATLESWRKALPGVPDDQIVIPRYHAKDFSFPPPNDNGEERDSRLVRILLDRLISTTMAPEGGKFPASISRDIQRSLRRAIAWWDSIPKFTPLILNQSLYVRKDKWKHPFDRHEFYCCLALCIMWLDLPKRRRSSEAAKAAVRAMLREQKQSWLRCETDPSVLAARREMTDRLRHEPPPTIQISKERMTEIVENTAAKLPKEKREEYYQKISEWWSKRWE